MFSWVPHSVRIRLQWPDQKCSINFAGQVFDISSMFHQKFTWFSIFLLRLRCSVSNLVGLAQSAVFIFALPEHFVCNSQKLKTKNERKHSLKHSLKWLQPSKKMVFTICECVLPHETLHINLNIYFFRLRITQVRHSSLSHFFFRASSVGDHLVVVGTLSDSPIHEIEIVHIPGCRQ